MLLMQSCLLFYLTSLKTYHMCEYEQLLCIYVKLALVTLYTHAKQTVVRNSNQTYSAALPPPHPQRCKHATVVFTDLFGWGRRGLLLEVIVTSSIIKSFGVQGWRSGESTRLPPMWPRFDSSTWRHMWVEFVGSLLCIERFSPGTPVSPLLKNQHLTCCVNC